MKDHNEYWQKLELLKDVNAANLVALKEWTRVEALPWLWDELGGAVLTPKPKHPMAKSPPAPKKLNPMNDAEAVRHGLMTSVADREKLVSEPLFYHAQLTMLDAEAKRYCSNIDALFGAGTNVFASEAVVHTLHRALLDRMRLVLVLLEDAAREVAAVPGYFGAWRRSYETPFEVFKGTEQIIYGNLFWNDSYGPSTVHPGSGAADINRTSFCGMHFASRA